MIRLFYVLYKIKLLSPIGLYRLFTSVITCGINLMTLLHFAEKKYSNRIALVDDHEALTYKQLLDQSTKLAHSLVEKADLQSGQKVGILCRNHASLVKSIFATSRVGADLYLLNTEISKQQFNAFAERHNFDLVIYDAELSPILENYTNQKILSYHSDHPSISNGLKENTKPVVVLPRTTKGKIVLQTSGTTGMSKDAAHQPSIIHYLHPFVAFIKRLRILDHHNAFIATPIYHGYGIAVLLLFIPLGKKVVITSGFNAKRACEIINNKQIEVVTVVPLMLQKMLQTNHEHLKSLKCIASGGAKLPTKLIDETFQKLGPILYNLYGTSESGLNFIATPQDLLYSATTIGKKIDGLKIRTLDHTHHEVPTGKIGQLHIQNDWSIHKDIWIGTGDAGYCDENGYYFLCGRIDDMVISGGENVYPVEVEQVLIQHPYIHDVAIIGIDDEQFGQRLKAIVVPVKNASLTEEELREWLSTRVARFQLPKEISIVDYLPYTPLGKLDKKQIEIAMR
ncbi:AMP-dependent synthetase [Bacillus timonensis]|uniref:AMP-dependent synthetase n=1 Tax=Bacillus timonensis TaxID=1033734 RepID=A0A4V3V7W4_9BACI|nr:AMP-binding protein [Bacillus timonensis]THE12993.1 AMP-dependent synthetase [Bacillus timonensis]